MVLKQIFSIKNIKIDIFVLSLSFGLGLGSIDYSFASQPVSQKKIESCVHRLPAANKDKDQYLTLGIVISLTKGGFTALEKKRGYDIAVAQINRVGGVVAGNKRYLLKAKYLDDAKNKIRAAKMARSLINSGVDYMIGPYGSTLTNVVASVTEKFCMPLVHSAAKTTLFKQGRKYQFGVSATFDKYFVGVMEIIKIFDQRRQITRKSSKNIAAIILNNDAAKEVMIPVLKMAKKQNIKIYPYYKVRRFSKDVIKSFLEKVKRTKPYGILAFGGRGGIRPLVNAISATGTHVPLLAVTHCGGSAIEDRGSHYEYILCPTQWTGASKNTDNYFGSNVGFQIEYELAYGLSPSYWAASGAASILVLADAIKRAGGISRQKVRTALLQTQGLKTFFGEVRFDATGRNIAKNMNLLQLQHGRFRLVWPHKSPTQKIIYPAPQWKNR